MDNFLALFHSNITEYLFVTFPSNSHTAGEEERHQNRVEKEWEEQSLSWKCKEEKEEEWKSLFDS